MNLSVQHITLADGRSAQRVSVLGRLDGAGDIDPLLVLLAAPGSTPLELACFDADTLPPELIEAIAAALDAGREIKVRAYRPMLAFSLLRLSLPVLPVPPPPHQALLASCRAVALAGSANSLDKVIRIVEQLPESNAAIFIAQHVQEDQPNRLDVLLKLRTDYSVVMPQNLMPVQPRTIYIAPPGHHMRVAHGLVYLTRDRKISYARPSIDVLFESMATEYGAEALVALLCGYGQDGVNGCAAVRAAGGCVLVEDGGECEGAGMLPDSAHGAGHSDHRLKLRALASIVAAAVSPRHPTSDNLPPPHLLTLFLDALHEHTGYDFRSYQRGTLERRVANMISQAGFASFFDFQRAALSNPQITQRLLTELSINVTEFFRHPEQFRRLREEILPYLGSFPLIKIWSAGCATGEEAYSLAMLLDELGLLEKARIFATDINPSMLELARAGLFPRNVLEKSRNNYAEAGGVDFLHHIEDHGRYLKVAQRYRERVLFHHHVLGQDGVFNEFQLIVCRNVMIYFEPQLQGQVLGHLAQSLHREGFLLVGPSDGLRSKVEACGFKSDPAGEHFYRFSGSPA